MPGALPTPVVLRGAHVTLRPLVEADAAASALWLNDPRIQRTLAVHGRTITAEDSRAFIRGAAERRDLLFAITATAGGAHVGNAGLHAIDAVDSLAELGLMIGLPDCWGRGYGTETVVLLCRHALGALGLHRVQLSCYANNPRALAVYRRVGFVVEGRRRAVRRIEGAWVDELLFGMLAGELRM
jgi:RimJ/RimL family protein N-acetyltransferase